VDNPEKDAYIERLEKEASEAGAAIEVAKKPVVDPHRKLLDLTLLRLRGIRPPTDEQIKAYEKALTDQKALQKATETAKKVDEETTALYGKVEKMEKENKELKHEMDAMRREQAFAELRKNCFWISTVFAFVGAGLFILQSLIGKGGKAGAIMILLSVFFGGAPYVIQDVVQAPWFPYLMGTLIAIGCGLGAWVAWHGHKDVKCRLTPAATKPE
jgi:cation transport ATPase